MWISNKDTDKDRISPQGMDALRNGSLPWQYSDAEKCSNWIIRIKVFLPWGRLAAKPVPGHSVLVRTSHALSTLPQDRLSDPVSLWGKMLLFYPKRVALLVPLCFYIHLLAVQPNHLCRSWEQFARCFLSFTVATPVLKVINRRKFADLLKALDSLCRMTWFGI